MMRGAEVKRLSLRYTVLLDRNEDGGYTVTVPALPGCVTEGDTIAESLENAREAMECYLESLALHNEPFPPDAQNVQVSVKDTEELLVFKVVATPEVQRAPIAARKRR